MASQGYSRTSTFDSNISMFEQKENRKGFGKFHVQAAGMINLKLTKRIATYFEFNESDVGILNENDDPGLELLYMMKTRGLITSFDISKLIKCLEEIESEGTAKDLQSSFETNGCSKLFSAQEEELLQETSSSWNEFYSSEESASCMAGATPETQSPLQSSRKRKIGSTDQNQIEGKKSSHRLSPCSESQIIYVLKQSEHNYSNREGNQRVNKKEGEFVGKVRECPFDELDDDDDDERKKNDDEETDCSKDGTAGNKKRYSAEGEEDDRGILVAAVLVGKNQEVKMLYLTRDRLQTKIEEGQIYKIRGHLANHDSILLTIATKIMKSAQDELFQDIKSEKKSLALTSLCNSNSTIEIPGLNVKEVKYGLPENTVISLKAVVIKIALHTGYYKYTNSFEKKAYLTVADSDQDRLTVISHDKHVLTSKLREGSIVKLLNFQTYRGGRNRYYADSNCLVSRKGSDVELINHEGLQKLQVLLPLTDSYQVEGKLLDINVDLDTYEACPRPQCHEKKVDATQNGCFYCKKCGETYEKESIVEGFFLELSIADGKDKDYIIFKSTIASTLQELYENIPICNEDLRELFEKCFFAKKIRMVVKPSEGPSNDVITSMQALI